MHRRLFLLTLSFLAATGLRADDASASGDSAAAAAAASSGFTHCGLAVWVCAALLLAVAWFVVEGFAKLRYAALVPADQLARLEQLLSHGYYQDAWQFCQEHDSFLTRVAGVALERVGRGHEAVAHALEEVSYQQSVTLKANMNYLSVIGVVAPMIGLTGTVIGMIGAFNSLVASGVGDLSGLAASIGEVLTSTAAGLIVAIPGFLFYYVFKNRAQTAIMMADFALYRLFENLPYEQLAGCTVGRALAGQGQGGETVAS